MLPSTLTVNPGCVFVHYGSILALIQNGFFICYVPCISSAPLCNAWLCSSSGIEIEMYAG